MAAPQGKRGSVKQKSARGLAMRVLRNIEQTQGFSNRILDEHIERNLDMDPRDRALATLLVYGVLRHRQRLDHHIDAAAHKPNKLKGELRWALRIAAYELLELERPLAIASSQACRALGRIDPKGRLRPVIGGILKNLATQAPITETGWSSASDLLMLRYSLPEWLARSWQRQLGDEKALARAKACSEIPWIDLRRSVKAPPRAELAKTLQENYPGSTMELLDEAKHPNTIRMRNAGDLHLGPLYQSGQLSVQSLGSQQAAKLLQVSPGEKVMDACCGMGTKTMQLLEALDGRGQLVAVDQNQSRLNKVSEQQTRLGLAAPKAGLSIEHADLLNHEALAPTLRENFDAILLDAPCTGLGNLARHPELRWTKVEKDVQDRAALQRELLLASIARIKPGGRLVYAVCSLQAEEGPEQMAWVTAKSQIADRKVELEIEQSWTPEDHQADGFYCARLRVLASS